MKKRTLAITLACAMSLAALIACGSQTNQPETPNITDQPSQSETVEQEQTPEVPEEQPEVTPEENGAQPEEVLSLELSHLDVTLKSEGSQFTLSGNLNEKLYFGSEDENVATVDENGVVTAVAPGNTKIVVETEDGRTAECVVRCAWNDKVGVEEENSSESNDNESKPETSSVDLAAFYEQIVSSNADFPAMMDLESEYMGDFYPGLNAVNLNQCVIYTPMMSAVACEIAMVECANAADVETVKKILQARIDYQVEGGAWYPETIDNWANHSKIVVEGNYVGLFVIPEGMTDAAAEFSKLF